VSYQDKPIASIRAALKSLLNGKLGTGVQLYDYFPSEGVREPCAVLQNVGGLGSDAAVGQNVGAGTKGQDVTAIFQFDIYHSKSSGRDEIADLLLYTLWTNRAALKSQNKIEMSPPRRIQDLPAAETGERLYRKSIDIAFTITMTAAA